MEEVDAALKRCSGMIDTTKMKPLVDILRALRERLGDSQGNLKPVAARLIGSILSFSDKQSQGKLGKVVYAPLINAAMNDNKKNMHDASMGALRVGTSMNSLEGEGPNSLALEPFVVALVGELGESELKVRYKICADMFVPLDVLSYLCFIPPTRPGEYRMFYDLRQPLPNRLIRWTMFLHSVGILLVKSLRMSLSCALPLPSLTLDLRQRN